MCLLGLYTGINSEGKGLAAVIAALGLMSGTSMDGVDAAIVETDGADVIRFGATDALAYPAEMQALLRAARGWDPCPEAEAAILEWHGPRLRARIPDVPDLIGFHGQTLAHDPAAGRTRQIGDGAELAAFWQAPVIWDFRSADMAAGGEGAPLAPFFHFHALRARGLSGRVAVVNIGGVGNVTWADLDQTRAEDTGALLAFDTGPGNAPLDDLIRARGAGMMDLDGAVSGAGHANGAIVKKALGHGYFQRPAPKSLDRDAFADLAAAVADLSTADAAATLAEITAASIAAAQRHFPAPVAHWLITGGGRHNPTLMARLASCLPAPVAPIEAIGLDGDMLEAQAFAWLAVRAFRGLPLSAPGTTGVATPVTGGRLSRPRAIQTRI